MNRVFPLLSLRFLHITNSSLNTVKVITVPGRAFISGIAAIAVVAGTENIELISERKLRRVFREVVHGHGKFIVIIESFATGQVKYLTREADGIRIRVLTRW